MAPGAHRRAAARAVTARPVNIVSYNSRRCDVRHAGLPIRPSLVDALRAAEARLSIDPRLARANESDLGVLSGDKRRWLNPN